MTTQELLDEVIHLPVSERNLVAQIAWQSVLNETVPLDLTPEEIEELDRRSRELDEHPELAVSWEELRAELRSRVRWHEE